MRFSGPYLRYAPLSNPISETLIFHPDRRKLPDATWEIFEFYKEKRRQGHSGRKMRLMTHAKTNQIELEKLTHFCHSWEKGLKLRFYQTVTLFYVCLVRTGRIASRGYTNGVENKITKCDSTDG